MGRIFWIAALGLSVLMFLGLGLGVAVFAIRDREFSFQMLFGLIWCLSLALLSFQLMAKRIINLPEIDPSLAPKPEDFLKADEDF
jgi:hypothetical protein